jgi:hypothetical protein
VGPISIRFERFTVFHTSTSGGGHDFGWFVEIVNREIWSWAEAEFKAYERYLFSTSVIPVILAAFSVKFAPSNFSGIIPTLPMEPAIDI